jgi:hypothetical protein
MGINLNPFIDPLKKAQRTIDNVDQFINNPLSGVGSLIRGGFDGFLNDLTGSGFNGGQVDKLKSVLSARQGLARQNRFGLYFNLPPAIPFESSGRDHELLCETISIPGKQLQTAENGVTYRRPDLIPYAETLDNVSGTFINTGDYYFKKLFDAWLNYIVAPGTNTVKYKDSYTTDIIIQARTLENRPIYNITLRNAFPLNVTSIELSHGSSNDYIRVTTEFAYTNINIED